MVSWRWLAQCCRIVPELQRLEVLFFPKVVGFRALLKNLLQGLALVRKTERMEKPALGYELALLRMLELM